MILCTFSNLFIYSIKNKSGFLYNNIRSTRTEKTVYGYQTENIFRQTFKFVYL